MDWIRENKFLTGFFAVVLIGALALGYLLYSALGSYSEVSDKYTQQADELHKLQSSVPYPDETNLKKFRDQKQTITQATVTLQQTLNAMQLPLEPMTPTEFQDRLRKSVTAIRDKAKAANVALG